MGRRKVRRGDVYSGKQFCRISYLPCFPTAGRLKTQASEACKKQVLGHDIRDSRVLPRMISLLIYVCLTNSTQ